MYFLCAPNNLWPDAFLDQQAMVATMQGFKKLIIFWQNKKFTLKKKLEGVKNAALFFPCYLF